MYCFVGWLKCAVFLQKLQFAQGKVYIEKNLKLCNKKEDMENVAFLPSLCLFVGRIFPNVVKNV